MTRTLPATAPIPAELPGLVRLLEATHDELLAVLERKRIALRRSDLSALGALLGAEERLVERLRLLAGQRERLLRRYREAGGTASSLTELATALPDDPDGLQIRLERIRGMAAGVQRENRIQWIVARSVLSACGGLIEMLANQGRKSPVYSKGAGGAAGSLLDATA